MPLDASNPANGGRTCVHPICHNLPMCGRYRLSRGKQIIEEHFDCISGEEDWNPCPQNSSIHGQHRVNLKAKTRTL